VAVYDSSVIKKITKTPESRLELFERRMAVELISEDENCIITPTVDEEIGAHLNEFIVANCKVYKDEEEPFLALRSSELDYLDYIRRRYYYGKDYWAVEFRDRCSDMKGWEKDHRDWEIVKEANILAEFGIEGADELISNDRHHLNSFCKYVYRDAIEKSGETPLVKINPFRKLW